jgi:hypothetical protein
MNHHQLRKWGTHLIATNISFSVAEWFLLKFELAPNLMEINLAHRYSYNHCGISTLNTNQIYQLGLNYVTYRDWRVGATHDPGVWVCKGHRPGYLCRLTHVAANGHGGGTYWNSTSEWILILLTMVYFWIWSFISLLKWIIDGNLYIIVCYTWFIIHECNWKSILGWAVLKQWLFRDVMASSLISHVTLLSWS